MLSQQSMDALKQIAKGIALQFGPNCEVVIHEISDKSAYSSIVAIENGHVTGRKVGDGPSHVVLEQLGHEDDSVRDQFGYLTRTKDGKILKSTSVYIRDETGRVAGPDDQGRQGQGHPLSQQHRRAAHHKIRRQDRQAFQYFQVYALFLFRHK